MQTLVTILHVMVCLFLMLTVLLQAGNEGGMGAAFGGGGSSTGTVFGGSGASSFLRKLTITSSVIFVLTSMTLAWMATPSTDPLKDYWSQQEQAKAAREKAHQQALSNGPAAGATDKNKDTDKNGTANTPENASPVDTGDQGGATAPAPADGSKAPVDGAKAPADGAKAPASGSKAPAAGGPAKAPRTPAATRTHAATPTPAPARKPPARPAAGSQPAAP